MEIQFEALASDLVADIRRGGVDAYGQPAERSVSDGGGNPCRYCLEDVPKGAPMLILAGCPFPEHQPYAETGPIFLCAEGCARFEGGGLPPIMITRPTYLVKGYGDDNRIVYGSGQITLVDQVESYCKDLLTSDDIAYLHIRSATNNCYQMKVIRDGSET